MTRAGEAPISVLYDVSVLAYGVSMPWTHATGIFRVVRELLSQIARSPELDSRLFCSESGFDEAEIVSYLHAQAHPLKDRFVRVWRSRVPLPAAWQLAIHRVARTESGSLPGRLRRRIHRRVIDRTTSRTHLADAVDVYHSFWNALPPPGRMRARARILTVYDLIPILTPDSFAPLVVDRFTRNIRSLDIHRDWALCISESTKRDLCAYLSMDPARVFVMPLAASSEVFQPPTDPSRLTAVRLRYGIRTPRYVLAVSTVHRRKGSLQIARCFGDLIRTGQLADASLVLVGTQRLSRRDVLQASGLDRADEDRIIMTGHIADADLAAMFAGARACVYLSRYEGFGLPPLEAMQCGTPVITSNTSSLPEVVGDAGIMVAPDDEPAICRALSDLWRSDDLYRSLTESGRARARQFTWQRSMRVLLDVYDTVLAQA